MRYYMEIEPMKLTNMDTLESELFENIDDMIAVVLRSSCNVYINDLTKYAYLIYNKYFELGYKEVATYDMENPVADKLKAKTFVIMGTMHNILSIRSRHTTRVTTKIVNAKNLFGSRDTVETISASVNEEDTTIGMIKAINQLVEQGHTGLTLSSNAFSDFKTRAFGVERDGRLVYGDRNFKKAKNFPELSEDIHNFVMKSFQGGLCTYNNEFEGVTEVNGTSYDVNSMYPSVMMQELMPYGQPKWFDGQFKYKLSPMKQRLLESGLITMEDLNVKPALYFQRLTIKRMTLKSDGIACVKNQATKAIKAINGLEEYYTNVENVDLVLNNIDLEMLLDNYNVEGIEYIGGWEFKCAYFNNEFGKYINHWMDVKANAPEDSFERNYAKLMLNSVYGKFAQRTDKRACICVETEDGYVRVETLRKEGTAVYAPVGAFITSYARQRLLNAIKSNKDNFIYSDTDSIYVAGEASNIEIHDTELGKWKEEFKFNKINVLGKKQYCVEKLDGTIKTVLAGVKDKIKDTNIIDFNDFNPTNVNRLYLDKNNLVDANIKVERVLVKEEAKVFNFVEYMRNRIKTKPLMGTTLKLSNGEEFVVAG